MIDPGQFIQYLELSEQLIAMATKDDLVECSYALATIISYYESRFGVIPHAEMVGLLEDSEPSKEKEELLGNVLRTLSEALGQIVQDGKQSH